ncbi:LptF/LptG family permease [Flavobacterium rakeshii]|uniref:LptF/LptG family permease n=1 Tax=Flavobacterium rakeshii TaxID=1038845 RepID=A0A6N8HCZ4_9FLAO|nr:LptF/LptG family permease [Flavobacterium rakeshii]MEE1899452.1 LptF/LptG family permease [Flavobacterium rakeshii]MUV03820.1 LptF/LptG family permease [Flavobacterium rakeshii]
MKILDRYILKSFITTFATVFIILFFIFILQGVWLFIAELAGKDLGVWLVIKFLLFYSPKMIPLVLPLSILLASIMTFGSFAENYEFAAMKSSGISLGRAMRGLTIFIISLSIVAFIFANNVIPKAEYKFVNLRKNIIQRQPAMAIAAGQFNAIGDDFNIKVNKKDGEKGEQLTGVTIHKRKKGEEYATIIKAERGLLTSTESSNLLQLELFDGYYYEELKTKNIKDEKKMPFAKSTFSKQVMNIDLSMLNKNNMDEEQISQTNSMLNISELNYTLDSLQNSYTKETQSIHDNIVKRTTNTLSREISTSERDLSNLEKERDTLKKDKSNLLSLLTTSKKQRILDIATNNTTSNITIIKNSKAAQNERMKNINNHWLAFFEKFVIAYACILMFFIGAPLGAIIRKGGIGLPIVFAVIIFIIFHFINTFGKKLAQENGIPPFLGSWMSSFVLTPLAILLTYRATNDIGMINMDSIIHQITKPFQKLFKLKSNEE